jgi:hypothetical protein
MKREIDNRSRYRISTKKSIDSLNETITDSKLF